MSVGRASPELNLSRVRGLSHPVLRHARHANHKTTATMSTPRANCGHMDGWVRQRIASSTALSVGFRHSTQRHSRTATALGAIYPPEQAPRFRVQYRVQRRDRSVSVGETRERRSGLMFSRCGQLSPGTPRTVSLGARLRARPLCGCRNEYKIHAPGRTTV
jgi:hypothetical protein